MNVLRTIHETLAASFKVIQKDSLRVGNFSLKQPKTNNFSREKFLK